MSDQDFKYVRCAYAIIKNELSLNEAKTSINLYDSTLKTGAAFDSYLRDLDSNANQEDRKGKRGIIWDLNCEVHETFKRSKFRDAEFFVFAKEITSGKQRIHLPLNSVERMHYERILKTLEDLDSSQYSKSIEILQKASLILDPDGSTKPYLIVKQHPLTPESFLIEAYGIVQGGGQIEELVDLYGAEKVKDYFKKIANINNQLTQILLNL